MVILFWEYCGIQGDSFLPLLFIMCLFLLTIVLCRCSGGYSHGNNNACYCQSFALFNKALWQEQTGN